MGGVGAYAWINNLVYLELTGYRTLDFKTLPKLGVDPFGAAPRSKVWRPIGESRSNRIGAITGLSLAPLACTRRFIHLQVRRIRMAL